MALLLIANWLEMICSEIMNRILWKKRGKSHGIEEKFGENAGKLLVVILRRMSRKRMFHGMVWIPRNLAVHVRTNIIHSK